MKHNLRQKMTPLPKQEVIEKLTDYGVDDDFLDLIRVDDEIYKKVVTIFDINPGELNLAVKRINDFWKEMNKSQ